MITLTTDFGYQDHYVGMLKGAIYQKWPEAVITDLSHGISPFNIPEAELVVRQSAGYFPKGTIHVICVGEYYKPLQELLLLEADGYWFIAPNHGLLALLFPELSGSARRILPVEASNLFDAQIRTIATAIAHLSQNAELETFTTDEFELTQGLRLRPVQTKDRMRGTIIHIDHYGNLLTNIGQDAFEEWRKGRSFQIILKRNEPLMDVYDSYAAVPPGDPLALWSASGHLMVAIHNGHAKSLLSMEQDDVVDIECI